MAVGKQTPGRKPRTTKTRDVASALTGIGDTMKMAGTALKGDTGTATPITFSRTPVYHDDGITISEIDPNEFKKAGYPADLRPTHFASANIPGTPYQQDVYFLVQKPSDETIARMAERGQVFDQSTFNALVSEKVREYLIKKNPVVFSEDKVLAETNDVPARSSLFMGMRSIYNERVFLGKSSTTTIHEINWPESLQRLDAVLDLSDMELCIDCGRHRILTSTDDEADGVVSLGPVQWNVRISEHVTSGGDRHVKLLSIPTDTAFWLKSSEGAKAIADAVRRLGVRKHSEMTLDFSGATFHWY